MNPLFRAVLTLAIGIGYVAAHRSIAAIMLSWFQWASNHPGFMMVCAVVFGLAFGGVGLFAVSRRGFSGPALFMIFVGAVLVIGHQRIGRLQAASFRSNYERWLPCTNVLEMVIALAGLVFTVIGAYRLYEWKSGK